jgi:HSP20 family protein
MIPSMFHASPFREARRLQEEMERLRRSATAPQGFPAINVYAHHDGIVITAELPGVNEDDLDITVHRDTVTLRGKRQDQPTEVQGYHRRERRSGTFGRTFSLPFQVDPERVQAALRNGILTVTLYRPEHDKPKRIRVSATS